jgi:hypothetical protein
MTEPRFSAPTGADNRNHKYNRQIHPHEQNRADNDMVDTTNHHRR